MARGGRSPIDALQPFADSMPPSTAHPIAISVTDGTAGQVDFATIVEICQVLSGETSAGGLAERLMTVAIERGSARCGLLALMKDDCWHLSAQAEVGPAGVSVVLLHGTPLSSKHMPRMVLDHVERTRTLLVLDDAAEINPFADDPYCVGKALRSVVCFPLLSQTRLVGALYLENSTAPRAFTPLANAMLSLLATQAAISFDTGRLHADIERKKKERLNADAALQASEERFALAVAGSNDGIWDIDLVDNRMFMSDRAQRLHGLDEGSETRFRSEWRAAIRFHPDDAKRRAAMLDDYIAGLLPSYDDEWRVQHADGTYRWVQIRGIGVRDSQNRMTRIAGSITDIDVRKRAELALKRSEERYALTMEAARDGHWDWLIDRNDYYVSDRLLEQYGMQPSERCASRADFVRGIPIHPDDRTRWEAAVLAHFEGKTKRFDVEIRILRDGLIRWMQLTGSLKRDPSGRPARWTGSVRDITDRKAQEVALRESEERFALAVAGSNDGIWDLDVATDQMFLSDRAQRIFYGLELGVSTRPRSDWWLELKIHAEDVEAVEAFQRARSAVYEGEWRVCHADGIYRWVRGRGMCVRDADDKPTRMAGSVSDIDGQKRAEAALQQAQRLEALGTLAGGIAHDFNNILGAILGFGEAALRNTRRGSRMRRDLESIQRAGERGRTLIERILAFSRTGVGECMLVQLEDVVQEALHLIAASAPARVAIDTELDAGNAVVVGDSTQVHQVLMNLMSNAVQAMPDGGTLRVGLHRVFLDKQLAVTTGLLRSGEYLAFAVRDTGTGIPTDVVGRIFDPFFTTKDVGAGTGLGLSLVHGIVMELGGAVDVVSEPGAGSTFTVYLPCVGETPTAQQTPPSELPRGLHEQVLLIDDEEPLLRLMTDTLIDLGYVPVSFESGREALAAFAANPERFDAVITDERMPGLSGTAMIRAVRAIRPSIPVLLVSGYLGPDIVEQAHSAGAHAVLRKPLSRPELAFALSRVLGSRGSDSALPSCS